MLATARWAHTATRLADGKVLVAGGIKGRDATFSGPVSTDSAELYDPQAGAWLPTGAMTVARNEHSATRLLDGRVLVAGGYGENSAELYDPTSGTWRPTGPLAVARNRHTATLLPDGRVLVAGGDLFFTPVASAEIYDPATETWSPTGSLAIRRVNHTASLLPNGTVLVAGGESERDIRYSDTYDLSSTEVWDPSANDADTGLPGSWRPGPDLGTARSDHAAASLGDGRVLVTGGDGALRLAEVYDPATDRWSAGGSLAADRRGHTANLLPSGRVLLTAGGYEGSDSAEVYDPPSASSKLAAPLSSRRYAHTATALLDGRVLVAGGSEEVRLAEVFTEHVVPALRIGDTSILEGNKGTKTATLSVSLSSVSTRPVTVSYATTNGTATAGRDYYATSGTLTFAPGEAAKSLQVTVVGDKVKEADEVFFVNLTVPVGASLGKAQGKGTILNDD
ncbi:MAG TPA: kelch repeat-containing protein [Acidimicrobiales bacterium]|nr:kelch repeat-containing protein [Acidimicrobiales bacterium]